MLEIFLTELEQNMAVSPLYNVYSTPHNSWLSRELKSTFKKREKTKGKSKN